MPFQPEASATMTLDPRRKANVRLAIVLASIALIFFLGFIVRRALLAG